MPGQVIGSRLEPKVHYGKPPLDEVKVSSQSVDLLNSRWMGRLEHYRVAERWSGWSRHISQLGQQSLEGRNAIFNR